MFRSAARRLGRRQFTSSSAAAATQTETKAAKRWKWVKTQAKEAFGWFPVIGTVSGAAGAWAWSVTGHTRFDSASETFRPVYWHKGVTSQHMVEGAVLGLLCYPLATIASPLVVFFVLCTKQHNRDVAQCWAEAYHERKRQRELEESQGDGKRPTQPPMLDPWVSSL